MDKPLKFFLGITIGFFLFAGFIVVVSVQSPGGLTGVPEGTSQDSLFVAAEKKAKANIDTLFRLYPGYPQNSFVKFKIKNKSGMTREVWGKIIELETDHVTATVLQKFDPEKLLPQFVDLSVDQILDWIVEVGNDKIRGGFTTQAMLILENKSKSEAELDSQLQIFLDQLE